MSYLNAAKQIAAGIIGLGVAGIAVQESLYDVDGGERAVIYDRFRGVLKDVKTPGMHFKIPYIQYPYIYDIKSKPRTVNTSTGSKDLQQVNISLRILSHPVPDKIPTIHGEIGQDYDDRVLPSIAPEILKAIVAQYDAEQLITNREQVSREISETLIERAGQFHLNVTDVSITHLTFMKEFERSIEHKQIAQQEAERAKFIVAMAEQEAKASVIRAEGESEAARIITEALGKSGEGVIQVRRIDAARDIAASLAASGNVTYLPSNGNMLLGLNSGR
jgi:prohibitin 1